MTNDRGQGGTKANAIDQSGFVGACNPLVISFRIVSVVREGDLMLARGSREEWLYILQEQRAERRFEQHPGGSSTHQCHEFRPAIRPSRSGNSIVATSQYSALSTPSNRYLLQHPPHLPPAAQRFYEPTSGTHSGGTTSFFPSSMVGHGFNASTG